MKASVIILDFHKSKRVIENVKSVLRQKTEFPYEVIVVDNSANPENAEKLRPLQEFSEVKVRINPRNLGYIRGNNEGVKASAGEYIFIVNPDIIWPTDDIMSRMVRKMEEDPSIAVLGPRQVNDRTGHDEITVRRFPSLLTQITRRTALRGIKGLDRKVFLDECRDLDPSRTQPVEWLQSSFWLTRRSIWEEIGGLDPRFFIFMSDPDYCRQSWEKGYRVVYFPEVKVLADGRRASAGGLKHFFFSRILRQHTKDAIRYAKKYAWKKPPKIF
jgi:GT2 family glycosyltransferase